MLKTLSIQGFRSCHDTTVDLGTRFIALVGRNGAGKSSILRAIHWLAKTVTTPDSVKPDALSFEHSTQIDITAEIALPEERTYRYRIIFDPTELNDSDEDDEQSLVESLELTTSDNQTRDVFRRIGDLVTLADHSGGVSVAANTPCIGVLTSILHRDHPVRALIDPVHRFFKSIHYYDLNVSEADPDIVMGTQYRDWLKKYEVDREPTPSVGLRMLYLRDREPALYEELLELLGPNGLGLFESIRIVPSHFDGEDEQQTGTPRFYAMLFTPGKLMGGAGEMLWLSNLSEGTRRALRLVLSELCDRRAVMLVEQPEDSLHSGMLRKLIGIIRGYSENGQMVFSTHSAELLDILIPEEIRLVSAQDGNTVTRRLDPPEIAAAREFLAAEGTLSDFFESLSED